MSARGVGSELDRRIAAALKATAGSTGPLVGTLNRVNSTHKAFKAQLASGELTHAHTLRRPVNFWTSSATSTASLRRSLQPASPVAENKRRNA